MRQQDNIEKHNFQLSGLPSVYRFTLMMLLKLKQRGCLAQFYIQNVMASLYLKPCDDISNTVHMSQQDFCTQLFAIPNIMQSAYTN